MQQHICTCMYATKQDKKLVTHVASIKAYNTCSYHLNFEPIIIVRKNRSTTTYGSHGFTDIPNTLALSIIRKPSFDLWESS